MNGIKKMLPLLLIAAMLGLTACGGSESSSPSPYVPAGVALETDPPPADGDANEETDEETPELINYKPIEALSAFSAISGEVISVEPFIFDDVESSGEYTIHIDGERGHAVFIVDSYTYVLGEDIAEGDYIIGFYLSNMFMALIYPPQYNVAVVVNGDFPNVTVDRFNEDLINNNTLQIVIDENTEILHQNSEPYEGELAGQILVVVYANTDDSVPAIVTPYKVVVLYERPNDMDAYDEWQYEIIVNGVGLADAYARIVGDEIFPTHVPLIPIAKALGVQVDWDYDNGEVSLEGLNGNILFAVGSTDFLVEGEAITLLQYTVVADDSVYVPLQFFIEVFGMNNAYFEGGQIFINNDEPVL